MTRILRSALMAAGVAALAAAPAAAQQTCRDMVERFAAAENLSGSSPPVVSPPAAGSTADSGSPSGETMSDKLGRSGGVLAPPAVGDTAVIDPPRSGTERMPTAPRVAPAPGAGAGSSADAPTGSTPDRAAKRAQMESLVTAARAAAARGNEQQCMDSLSKARALSEHGRGSGEGG
ncbi:hypothetical protein [Azospirillum sp. sgz301742]